MFKIKKYTWAKGFVFFTLLLFSACQKRDFALESTDVLTAKDITEVAKWYNSQLITTADTSFTSLNKPNWDAMTVQSLGGSRIFTIPAYTNGVISRKVIINLTKDAYTGVVQEYNTAQKTYTVIDVYSINGRFIESDLLMANGVRRLLRTGPRTAMDGPLKVMSLGSEAEGGTDPVNPSNPVGTTTHALFRPLSSNLPPCAAAVVAKVAAQSFSTALFAAIFDDSSITDAYGVNGILSTIMNSTQYPIKFSAGDNYSNVNALTSVNSLYPVTTEIQNTYIYKTTELSLVRTIIHESLHAYFQYGLANMNFDPNFANFQTVNSLLFDTGGIPLGNQNVSQHNQMVANYVSGIADMLETYANNNGITSPDPNRTLENYCRDLAWSGLMETSAYLAKSQSDRARIKATGLQEQDGTSTATTKKPCS
jgi:hypothetical protein